MSKILQIIFGIVSLALVPVWIFILSPEILKLPANYTSKANMIHSENNRFEIGSEWIGKAIAISSSSIKATNVVGNKLTVKSLFKVESLTGETLFELNQNYLVDRKTRHNLPGGNDTGGKSLIFFPPKYSASTINFWAIELGMPTELTYVGDKIIQQLNTRHFRTTDAIIDDTAGFESLPLVPEKYRAFSKVTIDVYVEPITGTIINYEDTGISYYADNTGKLVWEMDDWSNKYNDPTIIDRVKEANSKKTKYNIVTLVIPISLALMGTALISIGYPKKPSKKKNKRSI